MRFRSIPVACALFALPLVPESAAHGQEANWRGPLASDVAWILDGYYGLWIRDAPTGSDCRADEGELCYNGDHEDHNCRVPGCRTAEEVARLLADLTEAARAHPDDALAFAQAVYAFTRLRDFEESRALARECTFATWWCELLLGLVHDRGGRPGDAAAHFRSALPAAGPPLAARLPSIAELLGDEDRSAYQQLAGRERRDFERRFWWLSDPMWSIPGNDRWTAHIRRRFELVLHESLLESRRGTHRDPHERSVVRRGPEDSWSAMSMPAARWKSMRAARYRFTPVSALTDGIGAVRYDLLADRQDERYTPGTYGPVFELPAQFARFRQGDSLQVAGAALPGKVQLAGPRTVFMLSDGPGSFPVTVEAEPGEARPVFQAAAAPGPIVAGIESLDGGGAAARARAGLLPLDSVGLVLSDPLLVAPAGTDLPGSRNEAVARMLGTTTMEAHDQLAVYWEVYGAPRLRPLRFTISIEGERPGWFTRGLQALRIRSASRVPEVSWTETLAAATQPMAITVDIADLEDGDYVLRIHVAGPDGSAAVGERPFSVDRSRTGNNYGGITMMTGDMPVTRTTRLLAMVGAVLFMACGDAPTQEVSDARRLSVEFTEDFHIGDDPSERQFARISSVAFAPDGRLVVVDRDNFAVVVFDRDGREVLEWGGEGEGPGEFETEPNHLAVSGEGNVAVSSFRRVDEFAPDGGLIEQHLLDDLSVDEVAFDRNGDVVAGVTSGGGLFSEEDRHTHLMRLRDRETLWSFAPIAPQPNLAFFFAHTLIEGFDDGRVATAMDDRYEVDIRDASTGQVVGRVTRNALLRTVPEALKTGTREAMIGDADDNSPTLELYENMVFGESLKVFAGMFLGPPNRAIWVRRGIGVGDELAPPVGYVVGEWSLQLYDLFDGDTYEYIGTVEVPEGLILEAGDPDSERVAGVHRDALDVHSVRVLHVAIEGR